MRAKDVYRRLTFKIEINLKQTSCHVCDTPYETFQIGSNHVMATCKKCERRDEVGLTFYI